MVDSVNFRLFPELLTYLLGSVSRATPTSKESLEVGVAVTLISPDFCFTISKSIVDAGVLLLCGNVCCKIVSAAVTLGIDNIA